VFYFDIYLNSNNIINSHTDAGLVDYWLDAAEVMLIKQYKYF